MLCLVETNTSDEVTGVGPGQTPYARCIATCCAKTAKLQIRTRYKTGFAQLCAYLVDNEGAPDLYFTISTTVIVYHKFEDGTPIGDCTRTVVVDAGPSAIVSGADTLPSCEAPPISDTSSPDDCYAHLWDPPTTGVSADPGVVTISGDSATKDDTRSAAIGVMAWGDWSDWSDVLEIDLSTGAGSAGYMSLYLAEASCGDNGLGAGSFVANASQYESELRVVGPASISIAVSEGTSLATAPVNRYTLAPGTPQLFTVGAPSYAPGWVTDAKVLRCVCPPQFAPA